MVLVTLGGCHLLDGLVAYDSIEACNEIVWCFREESVSGTVLTPRGSQRANLVERDGKSTSGLAGSSARAYGKHSTWETVTCGSTLARGLGATLELVSTGT